MIPEIAKPHNTKCPLSGEGRCTVYRSRPKSCAAYMCEWLKGVQSVGERPDVTGVVVERHPQLVVFASIVQGQFERSYERMKKAVDAYVGAGVLVVFDGRAFVPAGMSDYEAMELSRRTEDALRR